MYNLLFHDMKYYFTALTTGASAKALDRYKQLNDFLAAHGHENLNYVHMPEKSTGRKRAQAEIESGDVSPFDYQFRLLGTADALICDITEPSTTVGFQVMHAISNKIPCLALKFNGHATNPEASLPIVFTKSHDGLLNFCHIDEWDDLEKILVSFEKEFINKPFKFNFYIPLSLYNGISRQAESEHKTKSELVRDIIDDYLKKTDKK